MSGVGYSCRRSRLFLRKAISGGRVGRGVHSVLGNGSDVGVCVGPLQGMATTSEQRLARSAASRNREEKPKAVDMDMRERCLKR